MGLELREVSRFQFLSPKRFSIGSIEVHLNVSEGMIKEAKIFGDFFGLEISLTWKKLVGQKYDKASLSKIVSQIDVKKYFGAIEPEELLTLLY